MRTTHPTHSLRRTRALTRRARAHTHTHTHRHSVEADLKDRKAKSLAKSGNKSGKGTSFEVSMDLDTGKGHLEMGGTGANMVTGKLKAVVGLFRNARASTKAGQTATSIPDLEKGSFVLGDQAKDDDGSWSDWLAAKAGEIMTEENLADKNWLGKITHKAAGNTLGGLANFGQYLTQDTGVEATWRVAAAWDLNLDGSGTCTDDCAAGSFEEDPWSASIEAQGSVAAHAKIFGSEHKVLGGVSMAAEIDGNGKVEVSANLKAQHGQDGYAPRVRPSLPARSRPGHLNARASTPRRVARTTGS